MKLPTKLIIMEWDFFFADNIDHTLREKILLDA